MLVSFILGTHPALSIAELKSVLGDVKFVAIGREAVVVDGVTQDLQVLQKRLGGTVKIGEVSELRIKNKEFGMLGAESIVQLVIDVLGTARTRAYFGISVYEAGSGLVELQQARRSIKSAGPEIKRALQKYYERVRWAVSREPVLSSVAVVKNKLLPPEGIEVQLIFGRRSTNVMLERSDSIQNVDPIGRLGSLQDDKRWYIGHTVTVQPFEEYGARDFGRPSRDDKSGMIPPKLAQMMINLTGLKTGATILDPFCGSGTILQEALLLGYNVWGSDASTTAVTGAKQNLKWLTSSVIPAQAGIHVKELDPGSGAGMTRGWRVEERNVLSLSHWLKPGQVDAIVTEPYLGPQHASKLQINEAVVELSQLYLKAFEQFAKILTAGQKVVMIWPVFTGGRERVFLAIDQQVQKLGFSLLTKRGELLYGREGQRVWREIVVWRK